MNEWKAKLLRKLRAGLPTALPVKLLGLDEARRLGDAHIIELGFPPESGDSLVLECEGDDVGFSVFKLGDNFLCREDREANPRTLELSADELRLCQVCRVEFYRVLASELGIDADPNEVARGIWKIGRRTMPGLGRSCIYLVEPGFRAEHLELALFKEPFRAICVLGIDSTPQAEGANGQTLVAGTVEVRSGCFSSSIFEDLVASVNPPVGATYVDLESIPQRLVICGEEFLMPEHRGQQLVGLKYLEFLIDHTRKSVLVWDVFLAANPGLSDSAKDFAVEEHREDDDADQDGVMTGIRQTDERPILRAKWEEDAIDAKALRSVKAELEKKREQLKRLHAEQPDAEGMIVALEQEITELGDYLGSGRNPNHRVRPIKHTDRDKARDSVRNGIKTVIGRIAKQNKKRARELDESISRGYEVMFTPPPDWDL